MKSMKKNIFFNLIKNLSNILFPLITYRYIASVLGPNGIGQLNFAQSFVQYFVILSSLGISFYGVRQVAVIKTDKKKLKNLVSELFTMNLIFSIISLLLLLALSFIYSRNDQTMLLIYSFNIFFNLIGLEWFYQGIEEYKYLAIRGIFVKILVLILTLIFVKSKEDLFIAASLIVISLGISNLYGIFYLKKFIPLRLTRTLNFKRHFKGLIIIFFVIICQSFYSSSSVLFLKIFKTDYDIGIYVTALKVVQIILMLITSVGFVFFSRVSSLKEQEQEKIYMNYLKYFFSICGFLYIEGIALSKEAIFITAGRDFYDSIELLKLLMILLFPIGVSNFIGLQILITKKREKEYLKITLMTLFVNLISSPILIKQYGISGAAFSIILTEIFVSIVMIILCSKYLKLSIIRKKEFFKLIGIIFLAFVNNKFLVDTNYIYFNLIIKGGVTMITYLLFLILIRDKAIFDLYNYLTKKRRVK